MSISSYIVVDDDAVAYSYEITIYIHSTCIHGQHDPMMVWQMDFASAYSTIFAYLYWSCHLHDPALRIKFWI